MKKIILILFILASQLTFADNFYLELATDSTDIKYVFWQNYPVKTASQTQEEYDTWVASLVTKNISAYTPVFDECKRCPIDKDGAYRYKYESSAIVPKANVQNITYATASFDINPDGTLQWK